MSGKKDDAMNRLVADYIAQSIKLDIYIEFFGMLPAELSNKCEQIAVKNLLDIDSTDGAVDMTALIDWRKKVMVECAALAREYRAKLMEDFGIVEEIDIGDAPPKGRMN